ncbi:hypothetical protein [Streptomyces caelestis]|uniref:hypothetical protein n=1 Tax=Streptomyces caelestis TaxID=36816 RepID=UPI0036673FC8
MPPRRRTPAHRFTSGDLSGRCPTPRIEAGTQPSRARVRPSGDGRWPQAGLGATASVTRGVLDREAGYGEDHKVRLPQDGGSRTGAGAATGADGGGPVEEGGGPGPDVVVDPSTPDLRQKYDQVFARRETSRFGGGRHRFPREPGTYDGIDAPPGLRTSVPDLGPDPGDVRINGDITAGPGRFNGDAAQDFRRPAENLALHPVDGTDRRAVARAAPFRRIHVEGGLDLLPDGYGRASVGHTAGPKTGGSVGPCPRRQWYTRDGSAGGRANGVRNMTSTGARGPRRAPSGPARTPRPTPASCGTTDSRRR